MSDLRVVLVRHSPRSKDIPEERAGLTERGRHEAQNLAAELNLLGVVLKHCFTSSRPHARQTAEILRSSVGEPEAQITEVEALTPGTLEKLFTIENIVQHASDKGITLHVGETVALVGHEGRLSHLISRMTGKRFRPLDHSEAICLAGGSLEDFRCGCAKVVWRIPVKAYQEEELRQKIVSKMTVATLLAGFSFAALVELTTGDPLPTLTDFSKDLSPIAMFTVALPWLAVICLTAASAFFIASAYIYDSLSMPEGFWLASSKSTEWERLPAFVRKHKDKYGLVYSHMVHTWTHVFTPGVALGAFGFLLLIINAASIALGVLCVAVLLAIGWYYWRVRPQLGVD